MFEFWGHQTVRINGSEDYLRKWSRDAFCWELGPDERAANLGPNSYVGEKTIQRPFDPCSKMLVNKECLMQRPLVRAIFESFNYWSCYQGISTLYHPGRRSHWPHAMDFRIDGLREWTIISSVVMPSAYPSVRF